MAHPSKDKGNRYEREIVNQAKGQGIPAQRAYCSNGQALGLSKDVDCTIGPYAVQAKRRKKIADYLKPDPGADVQIIREDRGQSLVVMPFELFLKLISQTP
jgi:hypothetical protein